jgi:7-carboxy-7-deazaguanine synthase
MKSSPALSANQLRVKEIYPAILGESSWAGYPAVIVRLSGCNLRCSYCDTRYAYRGGEIMTPAQAAKAAHKYRLDKILLTGGEPLIQPGAIKLLNILERYGCDIVLETNGAVDISSVPAFVHVVMDLKAPGSGCSDLNLLSNLAHLKPSDEIKIVLTDGYDYSWARRMMAAHGLAERFPVTLSPVYGLLDPKLLARWMLRDRLSARLGLQIHKYIFGGKARRI